MSASVSPLRTSSWRHWATAILATAIGGCQFERPANIGGPIDAPHIDATEVCTPATATCTDGRYTECDAVGQYVTHLVPNGALDGSPDTLIMDRYQCPMGCHDSLPQCADVDATNGLNAALDDPATSATGLDLVLPRDAAARAGLIVINTDNYNASTRETSIADADGSAARVPVTIVTQIDAPEIMVLDVRSFTLRAGFTIEVRGERALAIASHFDVVIDGVLDLSEVASLGRRQAPGTRPIQQACWGSFTTFGGGIRSAAGGGGGATSGGKGSEGSFGGDTHVGVEPLSGGCSGGDLSIVASIGHGGGAIHIASRTRVLLGARSLIDVSGGGGVHAAGIVRGGNSGGSVVIESPSISIREGAAIAGRGGSGAATSAQDAAIGIEGPTSGALGAASVTCTSCGTSGRGGTESSVPGDGVGSGPWQAAGGASVGVCRTRNQSGVLTPPPNAMRISHWNGVLPARSP